ncbi:MAG: tRNA dihydrouridine synthase DusB [Treponemataceae bacterium]|nr:tRNA dihydrouridine synthase DusB [Treponemataceae bacterium]
MSDSSLFHPVTVGTLTIGGNIFLAPVAGYSDSAFRSICRQCGAAFTYTEMVSAEALYRGSDKTRDLMVRAPNEDIYAIQLFGGDAKSMTEAVGITLSTAAPELIDINGGCPVPKIIKSGAGSSLTRDPQLLYTIVNSAVRASESFCREQGKPTVPVTVKIRTGWDHDTITYRRNADAALEAGAAAITMHGRTKAQGYEGKANWEQIADLVQYVGGKIPVFGNGDVFSPEDCRRMIVETGVDGVMFARGAMGNPFIFTQAKELLETGSYTEIAPTVRLETAMKELELLVSEKGENLACREMRKRFCCYSKGIPGAAAVRKEIVSAETFSDYKIIYNRLISNYT